MSNVRLFQIDGDKAIEIQGAASCLEKPLQNLIEANLEPLLGIRFLATEYVIESHEGRIDTLGIDENNCPVIIEYKRSSSENVINQGLFYLDWLMDHQAEFHLLVMNKFSKDEAEKIDWLAPRLLCIASDFTKYDGYAVKQINRNIDLIRYRHFGKKLLLLEFLHSAVASSVSVINVKKSHKTGTDKTVQEWIETMTEPIKTVFDALNEHLLSLGDEVKRRDLKLYIAYTLSRNFASLVVQKSKLLLNLHLDPKAVQLEKGFTRDITGLGRWGTGNLEVQLTSLADLEKAKPLIQQAYDGGVNES